ncbi:MAG: ABC transporter permease [Candidatus Rokubacteria bacterium]|nr:ABC transporter permease [Candidatus Rokubacteria bacterium]
MGQSLKEVWRHRDLVLSFAVRDVKARYKQTVFGVAWAIFQPFALMLVFTLVFSRFAKIPTEGVPYPVFSYLSLVFWTFFAMTISQGTVAIVANANLVRKIYFPRETLLMSIVLSAGLDLTVATVIFGGMLYYYEIPITLQALWVPVLLVLQTLLAFGVICFTSAMHVNFRDIGHAIPLTLQLWMFVSPVAYPLSLVPAAWLPIYLLNPMASIIEGYRFALLGGAPPNLAYLALDSWITLVVALAGYAMFKRVERTFADVI